jgi:hypothetical membrane protein
VGGWVLLVGATQFVVGMSIAILSYGPPRYDVARTTISDLQTTSCGPFEGTTVCSPASLVANGSVFVIGICLVVGVLVAWSLLTSHGSQVRGPSLLILGGAGAALNAFLPQNVTVLGDAVTAFLAFAGANLGLVLLGRGMLHEPSDHAFALYTTGSGIFGLLSLLVFSLGISGPLGVGGIEWLVTLPIVAWMLVAGSRLGFPQARPPPDENARADARGGP